MTVAENGKSDDKGEQTMEELLREVLSGSRMLHFEGTKKDEAPLVEAAGRDAGYVEGEGALYEKMTVRKYLKFFAGLSGTEKRVRSAVEQMHLSELLGKRLSSCTEGQKKRVRIAREIVRGAEDYFILNPIAFEEEESKKVILGWMESFCEREGRLITLSWSHRDTCICPGDHYEIARDGVRCIDQGENTQDSPELPQVSKISVSYNEKNFLFNPEEIDYVEANDGKVFVYVKREQYTGAFRMGELEEKLARFGFFRCHRSYIVNMQKVVELVKWTRNSYSLRLAGYEKTDVPLSKGKIQELRSMYEF